MSKQTVNINLHSPGDILVRLKRLELLIGKILMKTEELSALEELKIQLQKVKDEYAAQKAEDAASIAALRDQIAILEGQLGEQADPATVQATLDSIKALVQDLDNEREDTPVITE